MGSAEAAFEFAPAHFDEGWAAVGTGVRHVAGAKVFNELLELRATQGVVGLDRVATDRLGDDIFANPEGVHTGSGSFERIDQVEREPARIRGANERGEGVQQERSFTEFAEADTQAIEHVEVPANEVGFPNGDFDGLGQEQALGGGLGGFFHTGEHLLEEDAFVGSVLVEEDQPAVRLQNNVEATDDADNPERDGEEGPWGGRGGTCGRAGVGGRCRRDRQCWN